MAAMSWLLLSTAKWTVTDQTVCFVQPDLVLHWLQGILTTVVKVFFYAPVWKDQGHIVLPLSVRLSARPSVRPSVDPSVCLHKLNVKT